jgi:hypothetical protein
MAGENPRTAEHARVEAGAPLAPTAQEAEQMLEELAEDRRREYRLLTKTVIALAVVAVVVVVRQMVMG